MKKLGLFFVVLLCLSLFFVPNKGLAQMDQENTNVGSNTQTLDPPNKDAIVAKGIFDISNVPNYSDLALLLKIAQKDKLNLIANEYFKNIKPGTNYSEAARDIYFAFQQYLGTTLAASNGNQNIIKQNDTITAQIASINNLYNIYKNAQLESTGVITKEQEALRNSKTISNNEALAKETGGTSNPCTEKSLGIPKDIPGCAIYLLGDIIKTLVLSIAGFFLWAAANFLNFGIQIGILNFSTWAPKELYPLWQIVRQIVSLCIIFAGLYIGFMFIISSNSGSKFIERFLPWLVIFALFVNFSYPLSRAAIDLSNLISLNIYAAAVGQEALNGGFVSNAVSLDGKNTAGGVIMDKLGLQGLVFSATGISSGAVSQINGVAGTLLTIIFIFYAAYIFGFAALLIMIRNITLVLGIIASPLLFVDMVIPKFGEKAQEFRSFFFNQLALSVVFMIMLYFTISVMGIFNKIDYGAAGAGGDIATLAKVFISLVLLHTMLKVTREFSGAIGAGVEGLYKTATVGAVTGGAGALGRATLGRVAAVAADSKWVQDARGGFVGGKIHDSLRYVSDSATFDVRNTNAAQKLAGMGGIDLGKGKDTSYKKNLELNQKAFATKYNSMNETAKQKFAERTLSGIGNWDGQGERIAGETLYKAKNEDGSDVLTGEERQKIYGAQDRAMRKNLTEHDMDEATKIDKVVNLYEKKTGENKQNYFNNQSDDVKKILIGQDLQKSLMDKRETYSKTSNQARQSYFNSEKRTDEEKQNMINMDRAEAENIQKIKLEEDKKKIEEYQKAETSELGEKQKIYNSSSKALQSKLKADDEKRANEINDYKNDIEKKEKREKERTDELEKLKREKEAA